MRDFNLHTNVDENGLVHAAFDPSFLLLGADEDKRASEPGYPPNERFWRLETEASRRRGALMAHRNIRHCACGMAEISGHCPDLPHKAPERGEHR